MNDEFKGKRVLVTGGTRGIGAAVVRRLGGCARQQRVTRAMYSGDHMSPGTC